MKFKAVILTMFLILSCFAVAQKGDNSDNSGGSSANGLSAVSDSAGALGGDRGGSLFSQNNDCSGTGVASQEFPDFANSRLQAADDFEVPAERIWTINRAFGDGAFFNGPGPHGTFIVEIFEDNAGLPGSLTWSQSGISSNNPASDPNFDLSLSGASLTEGRYWLSVMAVFPFNPNGQFGWNSNNSTNFNAYAFQDPDGLIGGPCTPSWGYGVADCGIATTFTDVCFGLDGTDESVVTIPTLGEVGMGIFLVLLAATAVFYIRRQKTAQV